MCSLSHSLTLFVNRRIADTLATSLLAAEERTPQLLIEPLLNPLIEMTTRLASGMDSELGAVLTVNCFSVLRDSLLAYDFATPYVHQLKKSIEEAEGRISEDMRSRIV